MEVVSKDEVVDFFGSISEEDLMEIFENPLPKIDVVVEDRKDQRTKMSNDFIEMFKPYSFKNWNKKLFEVSAPYYEVVIPINELKDLVENSNHYMDDEALNDLTFYKKLKNLIKNKFDGQEFFAKFFTRSPKDIKVTFDNAFDLVCNFLNSMRTFEDMIVVRHATKDVDQAVIYLRPIVEFDKKNEFRLFYVNGFTSVCNYHKQDSKELYTNEIDQDVIDWNEEFIKPYAGVDDYCIDFIRHDDGELELIEINPHYLSDPILLDHTKLNLMNTQITYER